VSAVEAIQRELTEDGLVTRYRQRIGDSSGHGVNFWRLHSAWSIVSWR
jgi:hypothetical protein